MSQPTHVDLFAGIGGFSLAAERVGFRTIATCENDPHRIRSLKKNFAVKNYDDIRTIPPIRCDLVTGGFPCQPFSVAGEQRGAEDDRFLWSPMCDFIKKSNAAFFLGENVAGIIDMELDRCISDLEGIGYEVQPLVIPACAVGAWHRRDRVWIVAYHNEIGRQRFLKKKIQGQSRIQGCENVRRRPHVFPRPDLFTPRLCSGGNGVSEELGAYGNAIVPQIAEIILSEMMRLL